MLRVYGFPNTRTTRVTWALEEVRAEYELIPVNLRAGEHKKIEFLRINPFGKVPVLMDGELSLTESAAICTYIGEKFPDSGLVPPASNPETRAKYFQWCFFVVSELEAHLWAITKHTNLLPEDKKVPAIISTSQWEFERACKILTAHLKHHEYLAGEQFTAADILCTTVLLWAKRLEIELNQTLMEYMDRQSARFALGRARKREADSISL